MRDHVGQQLGNYRVLRLLGRGGFAEVYLGQHIYLNSFAALKVLHTMLSSEEQEAFVKEAQTLVRLQHPHIVRLLDFTVQASTPFLVMDYAPNGTLRQRHPVGSRLLLDTVTSYVRQVASALHYAHGQHLIHRDIKPENILVGSQDDLLLSDFGLAFFAPRTSTYSTQATTLQIAGTPLYLAPEQLQGRPLPTSDQYALAVLVYEWLCGRPPFSGTLIEVATQHLSMPPPPLREHVPDLPHAAEEVVMQALAKEPGQRFTDVEEFARALEWAYLDASRQLSFPGNPVHKIVSSPSDYVQQATPGSISKPEPIWKIPTVLTSVIGREQDVTTVCTLLKSAGVRLVTLLGTGGIGKTRLSLQVAVEMRKHFVDGVCFVPLAPVSDPELIMPTIAQELGIQAASALPIFEQVKDFLRRKHIFLLLDNFEQVVTAAPMVEELLTACPQLTILVTSRVVLHVRGEHEFPVSPLALPDLTQPLEGETFAQIASAALFVQRARSILPTFQLTTANAQAVAEICVRLDGLPLAIELAAARIKLLPPQALLARLSHSFELLTGGIRTLLPHQQTLRSTLKWSYDLLDASEQRLFRRLAVFVGGWTLEAVEAVCYYDREKGEVSALDEVGSLLDKSLLLQLEQEEQEPRLQMLMTVREYGLECLRESGEAEETHQAHAQHYLALAEEAEQRQSGGEQAIWLERLEREHDNFRAALLWLNNHQKSELMLHLSAALYWFWSVRGYGSEGYLWLEKSLTVGEGVTASVRAKALNNAGALAYNLDNHDEAEVRCQESLALYRQLGDKRGCAMSLYWLGQVACWTKRNYAQARAFAEESLALQTAVSDKSGMADSLLLIAYISLNQGNYHEARLFLEQGLACFREANDLWGMAYSLQYLGRVLIEQGDYALALTKVDESLLISNRLGYLTGIAYALSLKGHIALRQGDAATARSLIKESLTKHRERGQQSGSAQSLLLLAKVSQVQKKYAAARAFYEECLALGEKLNEQDTQACCLEGLGTVALAQGQFAWVALLLGAAAQLRQGQGPPMSPLDRIDYEQAEATARMQLGEEMYVSLWAQGHTMTPRQALTAQDQVIAPEPVTNVQHTPVDVKSPSPVIYPNDLTAREVEVLRLMAQGWTDAQIAEHLVISPRTVNKHATTIYSKIGVSSRGAATRYAIEHKLV